MKNKSQKQTLSLRMHGVVGSYIIGYLLSILLTIWAYVLVVNFQTLFSPNILILLVSLFAIVQFIIQLTFFLHIWQEKKPFWNLLVFISTIGIILIIVVGSIWIMNHLNYNMTPKQMEQYTQNQS